MAAIFILTIVYAILADIQTRRAEESREGERLARLASDESSREATCQAYRAHITAAQLALRLGKVASARSHLSRTPGSLRDWEWRYLDSVVDQSLEAWPGSYPSVWAVDFSPDGQLLAHSTGYGDIRVWDVPSRSPAFDLRSAHPERAIHSVDFHPRLPILVSASMRGHVKIWNLETRDLVASSHPGPKIGRALFHPGGSRLAVAGPGHKLNILEWSAETAELSPLRVLEHPRGVLCVDYSPDGRLLLSTCQDERLRLWSVETGEPVGEVDVFPNIQKNHRHRWFANFGPRGEWIAAGGIEAVVRIYRAPSLDVLSVLQGHRTRLFDMRFSPDRRWLVTTSMETVRVWDLERLPESRMLRGHASEVWAVAHHPHRSLVVTAEVNGQIKMWDPRFGGDFTELRDHTTDVNSVAISPSGDLLASGGLHPDQAVRVWDANDGRLISRLHGLHATVWTHPVSLALNLPTETDGEPRIDRVLSPPGRIEVMPMSCDFHVGASYSVAAVVKFSLVFGCPGSIMVR